MATVSLENMSKSYGPVAALQALDMRIGDGEFLTLLGPSGCGKSTALACIAGLEKPSGGRIVFGDRDVTRLEPHQRDIAMVFQDYALYPHMTVRENMTVRAAAAARRPRRKRAPGGARGGGSRSRPSA